MRLFRCIRTNKRINRSLQTQRYSALQQGAKRFLLRIRGSIIGCSVKESTLDAKDKNIIFRMIDKMLTNKKFKEFFQKNVAAL
jgi:hypothetical protein